MAVRLSPRLQQSTAKGCAERLESMRSYRWSWWAHWSLLAEMFNPRRYRWFVTANQWNRGSPMNQSIVDETGLLAARKLASGLLGGLTSPTKPWMRLAIHGMENLTEGPEAAWLAECTARMLRVFAESNFYTTLGEYYWDLGVFGSALMYEFEDPDNVINFVQPAIGEFFFACDNYGRVSAAAREYTYTVDQTVREFGLENCSTDVQRAYQTNGGKDREVVICHMIEPNGPVVEGGSPVGMAVPAIFKYREVYWEQGNPQKCLRIRGYREKPFFGGRWSVTSNDPYGRSPGMDALPAVRQLQIEQRRKAEAIDKMVRPPMVGSVSMKNEPMDILPGGVTFTTDPNNGFKPAFQVEPRIQEFVEDIKEVQGRVESCLFVDLFMMISQLDTVRTATEIDARLGERIIQIGPVIERFENEVLDPIISRTFAIMARRGLLPPPPPSLQGRAINVQYVSMLAEQQRQASTGAIERLLSLAGNLAAIKPDVMDNIDVDQAIRIYGNLLNVDPHVLTALQQMQAIRQQRAQAQQAEAALNTGAAAAQGAATLAKADLTGHNALTALTGGPVGQ
jgi:hypothetical protein